MHSDDTAEPLSLTRTRNLQDATPAEKTATLQEMFPGAKEYSIRSTLSRCNGNLDRAMDELLNHTMFDSGELMDGDERLQTPTKGIEAFSEDFTYRRQRGRKKNKGRGEVEDIHARSSLPTSPTRATQNIWLAGNEDVELIARYTQLSVTKVGSIYHKNGASSRRAIAELLDMPLPMQHQNVQLPSEDASLQAGAHELGQQFPSIPLSQVNSLVRLTHPSQSAARELAKILISRGKNAGGIDLVFQPSQVSEPSHSDDHHSDSPFTPVARTSKLSTAASPSYAGAAATAHSTLASQAFDQAASVRRKARSDHLMSGAAAYYTQVGRDHAAAASEARGAAADDLVASQSGSGYVDLHGVSVKDAVRIAKEQAQRWWRDGGRRGQMGVDGRVHRDEGSAAGLEIITGVGRHSAGGRGVVGPAVGRMLVNEGWNVRFQEGVVIVTGKSRQ